MTYEINSQNETATITVGENSITVPVSDLSDLVGVVFGARKAGYEAKRQAREAATAERKAKAEAKKAAKAKTTAKRKAERIAKLKKQLAELEKKAA